MTQRDELSVSAHERAVMRHYEELTVDYYIKTWNPDHIHLGLFEEGECPTEGGFLGESVEFARPLERMIEAIVTPAMIEENHHVVDAGCGIGGTAIHLARTRGCMVTGVNLSRKQLEIAREKVTDAGLDGRVRFEYGNCSHRLPFAGDSVDAVVNIESACHYSDRGQFLREVYRILKPGRRIAAMDWLMRDGITVEQRETWLRPMYEPWAMRDLESQSTYTELLCDAGLKLVEFEGFNGKELGNLEILEKNCRLLRGLVFLGRAPATFRRLIVGFETMRAAWRSGCFTLGRYCAEKPDRT